MNIVDAHHHIWRQADLPWLTGPMQPRIFGPYGAIRRDYGIAEYRDDVRGTGVVQSVYVQANWPVERFADEVAWVQSVADETGWPQGIVGYCDMTQPDARPALDRLTRHPAMRGIRQQLHWHENPLYRFAASPDLARDPTVRRNVSRLADYGWSFDLQVFAGQMPGATELAAACPNVTFVLQHAGMPEDLSESGWTLWRSGMRQLASRPNVVSKLSAFGTFLHRNDPDHIARLVGETVSIFGADRCLYGSNFPIEKLWTPYRALLDAFRAAARDLSDAEQRAVFADTARRVYRLSDM
jgi:predicted TIM-barrel fold metal-dependent hydrolase